MAKFLPTVWSMEPHTAAKHRILQKYLQAWFPIMSASPHGKRLVYIDGFAGPGVYAGGEPGSPIIALRAFLDHQLRRLITGELIYVFIEEDRKRADRLREEVKALGDLPDQVKWDVIRGSYETEFGAVLDHLEVNGQSLAPTFAFVDPFGYTQATMAFSGRFLQFNRCEVLIYVPIPFLNRFLGDDDQEAGLNSLFGCDEWKRAREMGRGERVPFLRDLFYRQMKTVCGLKYVRAFDIVSSSGSNAGYTLFFGTNNLDRGLRRMKETMWSIDPVRGQDFRDTTNKQSTLFEEEPDLSPLREALVNHFGDKPFTVYDAERFTLAETPYIPKHLKKPIFKVMETDDELEIVDSKPGRRRGTYPDGTVLKFSA